MKKNKYSDLKIAWFPDKLRSFVLGNVTPPVYVRVKPTNRCNHNCWFCVYDPSHADMHHGMNRRDELSTETLMRVIDDLGSMEVKAVTFSGGGEPLCHPGITQAMEKVLDHGMRLSIITNGQVLHGERARVLQESDWVRVSADYYDEESFKKSRGGTTDIYRILVDNIGFFGSEKKICDFGVNFIVNKDNVDFLEEAYALFRTRGVNNIRFSPVWVQDTQKYHEEIKEKALDKIAKIKAGADIEVYDSYSNVFNAIQPRTYKKCFICQTVPVVAADGFIYACHNMSYEPAGRVSDVSLKNTSFKEIWYSDKARKFFNDLDPSVTCTGQCSNDHKNILMHNLLTGYGDPFV